MTGIKTSNRVLGAALAAFLLLIADDFKMLFWQ
jgi:hypothetical protein